MIYVYISLSHTHTYIYICISNSRVIKTDEQRSPVNQQFRKTLFQQFYDIAQKMTAKIHGFPTETNQFGELLEILLNNPLVILT